MLWTTWRVHPADPERAHALARSLGVHQTTAHLLLNRGIRDHADARRFLSPSVNELEDPSGLPGMDQAAARIRLAVARREPILIFGDSDVDGMSGAVILEETLRALGALARVRLANRLADGYGLPRTMVSRLCRSSIKLLVLVDCGTNQLEEARELAACGIDTVVLDHHVPQSRQDREPSGGPCALVNPQLAEGPGRGFCSAGLALKLAQALLGSRDGRLHELLDLAALGTLADCAPLTGDNRAIVAEGLPRITASRRPGLWRLCQQTRVGRGSPDQIIKRLVPRLNAGGRLGDATAAWHALRRDPGDGLEGWLDDARKAHERTAQLHRQVVEEAAEQVSRMHFRDQVVVIVSREGWPPGLMGPLAAHLSGRYARPTIAVAMGPAHGVGSGRSIPQVNLLSALQACASWLVRFGGHAQACGLTVERKHLERFQEAVNHQARRLLGSDGLRRTMTVDCELPLSSMASRWVAEIERFAPFGAGNPRPTVLIRRVRMERESGGGMALSDGLTRVRAKGVRLAGWIGSHPDGSAGRLDVVASPVRIRNEVTLMVQDAKASEEP